ncbi:DUF4246 family protein [Candidatus Bathyarchaeota archaeon]|nr:DUF4246 family protein [Candidatus Bathyarchaeota archaeon]
MPTSPRLAPMRHNELADAPSFSMGHHSACQYHDVDTCTSLVVREIAMMMIMEGFTDKPEWHLKIFDDEIASQWAAEALELPVKPLYDEIMRDRGSFATDGVRPLDSILDRSCVDYVRPGEPPGALSISCCHANTSAVVHRGAPRQGALLRRDQTGPHTRRVCQCGHQVRHAHQPRASRLPPRSIHPAHTGSQ